MYTDAAVFVDDVPPPAYLSLRKEGTLLALKVQPRASRNEIGGVLGNELKVKVTAPPVDSAANEALIMFLAEKLGCSRSAIQIIRGSTSHHKQLLIRNFTPEEIAARLTMR